MQFLIYCLCGGLGVSADYAVYYLCLTGGVWYQYANGLGYLAGTVISFSLNRIFTFAKRDRVLQRLGLFLTVAAVGFAASALFLWLLVDLAGLDAGWAKLITLPMVVLLQFSFNRRITFKN